MLVVRLVNRRRNRLRPTAAFTYPCCRPATGLIRAYSDGGPVIATNVTGGSKPAKKQPKTDESIAEGPKTTKKPRKPRSDAGTSREVKSSGNPPKPRTPSAKPRKKRSDAGTALILPSKCDKSTHRPSLVGLSTNKVQQQPPWNLRHLKSHRLPQQTSELPRHQPTFPIFLGPPVMFGSVASAFHSSIIKPHNPAEDSTTPQYLRFITNKRWQALRPRQRCR